MASQRCRSSRNQSARDRSTHYSLAARHKRRRDILTTFIRQLRLLLLGLWLGAAIFFGAAVAPALFNVLRGAGLANANELAGSVVTRLLGFINQAGVEIALFLFVTAFFVNRTRSRLAQ